MLRLVFLALMFLPLACLSRQATHSTPYGGGCGFDLCLVIEEQEEWTPPLVKTMNELRADDGSYHPVSIDGQRYDIEYLDSGRIGDVFILKGEGQPLDGKVLKLPQDSSDAKVAIFWEELKFENWLKAMGLEAYGTGSKPMDIVVHTPQGRLEKSAIVKDFIGGSLLKELDVVNNVENSKTLLLKLFKDFSQASTKPYYDPLYQQQRYGVASDLHGRNIKLHNGALRIIDARFESCDSDCSFVFDMEFERSTKSLGIKWAEMDGILKACAF